MIVRSLHETPDSCVSVIRTLSTVLKVAGVIFRFQNESGNVRCHDVNRLTRGSGADVIADLISPGFPQRQGSYSAELRACMVL